MVNFEWDEEKAARTFFRHRVSFEQAAIACADPFAIEWTDTRFDYGEEPGALLGLFQREVLYVAFTERDRNIRIISARRANKHEQDHYYRKNGT